MRIGKAPFTVIGVLGAKGQSAMGQDQDDVVFVPLTTAMNRLMGITYVNNITIQAKNENVVDSVQGEVEQILREQTPYQRPAAMTILPSVTWRR
jgi:putative ABC transport system permease protein